MKKRKIAAFLTAVLLTGSLLPQSALAGEIETQNLAGEAVSEYEGTDDAAALSAAGDATADRTETDAEMARVTDAGTGSAAADGVAMTDTDGS